MRIIFIFFYLDTTFFESDRTATTMLDPSSNSDIQSFKKSRSPTIEKLETNQNTIECIGDSNVAPEASKMLTPDHKHDDDYTVSLINHYTFCYTYMGCK